MTQKTVLTIVFLLVLCSLELCVTAAETPEKIQIYKNDFSTEPADWTTKNPTRYYWVNESETYHYLSKGGTSGYACVKIPAIKTGFLLEFDVTPTTTTKDGAFRFGVGKAGAEINSGPLVMVSLENTKYGNIFYLSTITDKNVKTYTSSSPQDGSYGGAPVRFEANTTYHIYVRYDPGEEKTTIRVTDPATNSFIWGFYTDVNGKMEKGLDHLFITSVGDGLSSATAEGYIDNIDCYILDYTGEVAKTMTTPTPDVSSIPQTAVVDTATPTLVPRITPPPLRTEIQQATAKKTQEPVTINDTAEETPASPVSLVVSLIAITSGMLCIAYRRRR